MPTSTILTTIIAGTAVLLASPAVHAFNMDIEQQLKERYALTKLTGDKTQVVTPGAVLTLRKDGLLMTQVTPGITLVGGNSYSKGKISTDKLGKASKTLSFFKDQMAKVPFMPATPADSIPTVQTRTYAANEKVYITRIELKDKGNVEFEIFSASPAGDSNYRASLTFPRATLDAIAEVFDVVSMDNAQVPANPEKAPQAPQTPVEGAAPVFAPLPPPPPPPAEPPTVSLGMSSEKVLAVMGPPQKIIDLAAKRIYIYKDFRVILNDGKVSDIQ